MNITGPGVYLLPAENEIQRFPGPKGVLPLIEQCSTDMYRKLDVAEALLKFSANHNSWCGVEESRLAAVLQSSHTVDELKLIKRAFDRMLAEDLIEIVPEPRHKGMFAGARDAIFSDKIVCPKRHLIEHIRAQRL